MKNLFKEIKKIFWNPILIGSSFLISFILVFAITTPKFFLNSLSWVQSIFVLNISWFYVLLIFCFFCACLYLAFGPYRKVRLGKTTTARYNNFTWIAMLFSAGMGTGLIFSGVYEPLYHYFYPHTGKGGTAESLTLSFQLVFLHWGFSGWTVYTIMGLAIAYFFFHKNLPLRISSMLYPIKGADSENAKSLKQQKPLSLQELSVQKNDTMQKNSNPGQIKEKIKTIISTSVDVLSITVILFGVATTLGRGSLQINSGLKELFGWSYSQSVQSGIICVITLMAGLSLLSGLNKGIRRLSELNIFICILLLLFILFTGPTVFLLNSFVEYSGAYLQNLVSSMTYVNSLGSAEWRAQWTILYWAWWMAWAPFVGLFIARISEGRTIQQFVIGSLVVPTVLSCFWFVVFGGTAIQGHIDGTMDLKPLLQTEYSTIIFEFFKHLPFTKTTSLIALLAIVVFFVTSSDSASYVVHCIAHTTQTQFKNPDFPTHHEESSLEEKKLLKMPPTTHEEKPIWFKTALFSKIYWVLLEGVLAMTIIYFGGMKSLELLVIIMAFPFSILLCLICYSFFKEMRKDFSA